MANLYYTNQGGDGITINSGDGTWANLLNWNTAADGSGTPALGIPWTDDGTMSNTSFYAGYDLVGISLSQILVSFSGIGLNPDVTGVCNIIGVSVDGFGTVYGGTFTGNDCQAFETTSTINGGLWTGINFNCLGIINGGTFTGDGFFSDSGAIYGGTFTHAINNNGPIFGGTFTGDGSFNNNNVIYGGLFTGNAFFNYSEIDGGLFTGSGFTNNSQIVGGTFTGDGFINNSLISGGSFQGINFTQNGDYVEGGTFEITGFILNGRIPFQLIHTTSGLVPYTGTWQEQVWSAGNWVSSNILYYNNVQEDDDWGNLLNWWQNGFTSDVPGFTVQATALPTSANIVNLYSQVLQNTQGANQCFCHDASFWSANFGSGLTIVSTGIVNVHGISVFNGSTDDGISMHDSTIIGPDGVIATTAVLRDGATNQGAIIGNAEVHYDGGNGVFPIGGTVGGSVTYIGWTAVTPQWFNDDLSVGGGNDGDFSNQANWWTDSNYNVRPINDKGYQELPDPSTDVFIATGRGFDANTGTLNPTVNSVTTNNGYISSISITVSNGVLFSGDDYYGCYHATIYGNVTFAGTAYNDSSMILGNADYKSAISLVNSFYYNSLQRILSGGVYGSNYMTVNIPTGNSQKGFLSSLLGFPWYIRF